MTKYEMGGGSVKKTIFGVTYFLHDPLRPLRKQMMKCASGQVGEKMRRKIDLTKIPLKEGQGCSLKIITIETS